MTPKQVTTIALSELREIELRCECGRAFRIPLPMKAELQAEQKCVACGRTLWLEKHSPTRKGVEDLIAAIIRWNENEQKILTLSFVVIDGVQK